MHLSALLHIRCILHALCVPTLFTGDQARQYFSGVFFTPDDDLLDVMLDKDVGFNVARSFISSSEGRAHTPFVKYAVLGDSPDVAVGGGRSNHVGAFLRPRPGSSGRKIEDSAMRGVRWHRGIGERVSG